MVFFTFEIDRVNLNTTLNRHRITKKHIKSLVYFVELYDRRRQSKIHLAGWCYNVETFSLKEKLEITTFHNSKTL